MSITFHADSRRLVIAVHREHSYYSCLSHTGAIINHCQSHMSYETYIYRRHYAIYHCFVEVSLWLRRHDALAVARIDYRSFSI